MSGAVRGIERSDIGGAVVLDDVYGAYWDRLVWWLACRAGDRGLAEDLAQDTFERFAGALDSFDASRPVWPYLRAIGANVLIDHARRAGREVVAPVEVVAAGQPDEPVVDEQVVLGDLLGDGLETLPERQRVALELQYVRDWCVEDAAAFLGMTAGSFRQLSLRARRTLGRWLRDVDGGVRGMVVPVALAARQRVRTWRYRAREVLGGAAPSVAADAVASVVLAAGLGLVAVVGALEGPVPPPASPQLAQAATTTRLSWSEEVPAHTRQVVPGKAGSSFPVGGSEADDGRTESTGTRIKAPASPASTVQSDVEVTIDEDDERFYANHEITVTVGDEPVITVAGGTFYVGCRSLIGDYVCAIDDMTEPVLDSVVPAEASSLQP